jgi:3D (Asp-Asp-Asp) domain-containing protein
MSGGISLHAKAASGNGRTPVHVPATHYRAASELELGQTLEVYDLNTNTTKTLIAVPCTEPNCHCTSPDLQLKQ